MDVGVARWLVSQDAVAGIELAQSIEDPSSVHAGEVVRRHLTAERAAAVLNLETLRRKGRGKLGDLAGGLFFTREGLEQATRWDVARWRARQLVASGVRQVIDAGCGLGIDALAAHQAGLAVSGIEADPATAIMAEANIRAGTRDIPVQCPDSGPGTPEPEGSDHDHVSPHILTARIEDLDLTDWLADPSTAIFLDPSRRTVRGRSWDVADLSPSWEFVFSVITRSQGVVVVKLAPGFPRRLLPEDADVTWVSHRGDMVETTVWSSPASCGTRQAVVLSPNPPIQSRSAVASLPTATFAVPSLDQYGESYLAAGEPAPAPDRVGAFIYEPDPAVIRAEAVGRLARMTRTHPVAESIAYLTGDEWVPTQFATGFEVVEKFGFSEKALRAWVRKNEIGSLEIKTRGLNIDPAVLRRSLHLKGKNSTVVILTPTTRGNAILVVRRTV
ncbi:MAG: SAM-dependent methyltransferase [Propionibacteriaceae bacterium]|nr:SAM-dependent methyltransferase [Propionibacteriaceae bacterium]